MQSLNTEQIANVVGNTLANTKVVDMHTHLFMPSLGELGLWGIDELITYHYLEAELFRFSSVTPEEYFRLPKSQAAELIWRTLFVENTPISEAARGVIAVLEAFGLPTQASDLAAARKFFGSRTLEQHITEVFALAGVSEVVMTNDPLDPAEAPRWNEGPRRDSRFHAALRLDRLLANPPEAAEARRFLEDWTAKMHPSYMACSLADSFTGHPLIESAVLPVCREFDIPLSLMMGVRRQLNPALRAAGDGVGRSDLSVLESYCVRNPQNRFLVSVLSRENQHALVVLARKFANLMPFGCWWFLNNPSIVEEITRERIEMLGMSFIPQHSDARILEQVIYKWKNTRRTLAPILANAYRLLAEDGLPISAGMIERDCQALLADNFQRWVSASSSATSVVHA